MRILALCAALFAVNATMCESPDPATSPSPTAESSPTAFATPTHGGSPTHSGTPTPTSGTQPTCDSGFPAGVWGLAGTTTWSTSDDSLSWSVDMVVEGNAECEPWASGWGYLSVTLDGEQLAPVALPYVAAEYYGPSECPNCAAVWDVASDPQMAGDDPDGALETVPASWLRAWTEHRIGVNAANTGGLPVSVWWDMPGRYPSGAETWGIGYYATDSQSQAKVYPYDSWSLTPSSYWPLTGPTGAVWTFDGSVVQRNDGTTDWDGVFTISAWASRQAYNSGAPPKCTQPVVGWGITEVPDERALAACPDCTLAHRLSMTQTVIPLPDACPNDPELDTFARLFGGHHFAYRQNPPALFTDFTEDLSYHLTLIPVAL